MDLPDVTAGVVIPEPDKEPEVKPAADQAANQSADQKNAEPKIRKITLRITPPSVATWEHWSAYTQARNDYMASPGSYKDSFSVDVIGGLEMLRRGWWHIEAPEEIMQYIRPYLEMPKLTHIPSTPPAILYVIVNKISREVESSTSFPLLNDAILIVQ